MSQPQKVVLFDGVCNLCNGFIQFLIKRDSKSRLHFGALQSEGGKALRKDLKEEGRTFDSVGFFDGTKLTYKSTAVIQILKELGGGWKLASLLYIFPRFVRDWVYDMVAKNRYKWFGKRSDCMVPTPEIMNRFI